LLRELNAIVGNLLAESDDETSRAASEHRLISVGVGTFCMSAFSSKGRPTETCRVCVLLSHAKSLSTSEYDPSLFAPSEWMAARSGPVLVQPLTWGGEALGLVCCPLGGFDGLIYEQIKETLSVGLFGYFGARKLPPESTLG
jgi:hypothetical protein